MEKKYSMVEFKKERDSFKLWQSKKESLKVTYDNTKLFVNGQINEDAIKAAIEFAFGDITPRTMKKAKKDFSAIKSDLIQEKRFVDQYRYISRIEKDEESFREWHTETCDILKEFLVKVFDLDDVTFGKLQKVVNMIFKNLYCFDNADKHENYFRFCDMPLDSYTLEWVKREWKKRSDNQSEKICWSKITWSNLDKNEYTKIQSMIKKICTDRTEHGMTVLQLEFVVWPEIQKELAVENLLVCYGDEGKELKCLSLSEKLTRLKEKINETA